LLRGEAPAPRATTAELPGIVAKETTAPRSAPQWEQADVRGLQVERTLVVPPPGNALAESDAETSPSPILQSAPRL